jgi:DNA (cytosine-5)-methyltransferase 1
VLTTVSLFSGCGGLDLGFSLEGFKAVASFEVNEDAASTYSANFRLKPYKADVSLGYPAYLRDQDIDVLLAGPPCQGFSTIGRQKGDDPRNGLLRITGAYVVALRPRVVVIENVLGLVGSRFIHHLVALEGTLRLAGYSLSRLQLNAADHGVAQSRQRLFLIGVREAEKVIEAPRTQARTTIRRALSKMAGLHDHKPRLFATDSTHWKIARHISQGRRLSNVRQGPNYVRTWDIPCVFGETSSWERAILERIAIERRRHRVRDFGDGDPVSAQRLFRLLQRPVLDALTGLVKKGFLRKHQGGFELAHTYNGSYHRLRWDSSAPTVDTKFGNPRLFLHPGSHRGLTVREAARLQGFPDSFAFTGTTSSKFRQVGNAVPPPLARAVAKLVREIVCQ